MRPQEKKRSGEWEEALSFMVSKRICRWKRTLQWFICSLALVFFGALTAGPSNVGITTTGWLAIVTIGGAAF